MIEGGFRPKSLGLYRPKIHVITFTFFNVFLKIQKNMTFYVFLLCFTRFLELCCEHSTFPRSIWSPDTNQLAGVRRLDSITEQTTLVVCRDRHQFETYRPADCRGIQFPGNSGRHFISCQAAVLSRAHHTPRY